MSRVFFISDLHLGHKGILNFSPNRQGTTVEEHDQAIVSLWNSVVTKRDIVYVLGDVCFDMKCLPLLSEMRGTKRLIRGNHDKFDTNVYLKYFDLIQGFMSYKGFWLSHCPIHPTELRGRKNIHGHVHNNIIQDENYISVCVESCQGVPVLFESIWDGVYTGGYHASL